MPSVIFICAANICRSPLAENVYRHTAHERGLAQSSLEIASAATHGYKLGNPPDPRVVAAAVSRGYTVVRSKARQVTAIDFDHFDQVLAMDRRNLLDLTTICPTRHKHKIELFLEYGDVYYGRDVPDPYGGGARDFERVLDMIEDGCRGLAAYMSHFARGGHASSTAE